MLHFLSANGDLRWAYISWCLLLPSLCSSESSCNYTIPHGNVGWCAIGPCRTYFCDDGYEETVETLTCSESGEWRSGSRVVSVDELCKPKPCTRDIPNGALSGSCVAKVGFSCEYICEAGYQKKPGIVNITCEPSTNWSSNPHELCTNDRQCSQHDVVNGRLALSCRRRPGDTCSFTCDDSYHSSSGSTVYCGLSLTWNKPLEFLCKKIRCPVTIPNGTISGPCTREYKSSCRDYQCNEGFVALPVRPFLKCNATGQWEWFDRNGPPCARADKLCPAKFENGAFTWHCNRQHGTLCTYSCERGCVKSSSTRWLTCGSDNKWIPNTVSLCTKCHQRTTTQKPMELCPATIENGHISPDCARKRFAVCSYTCESNCRRTWKTVFCNNELYWTHGDQACECTNITESTESVEHDKNRCPVIAGLRLNVLIIVFSTFFFYEYRLP